MKIIHALLGFLFFPFISLSAPADITVACDLALPLNGITSVRFYERTATVPLLKEVPVTSTGTTGNLTVTTVLQVPDDGAVHSITARSYNGGPAPVFPATTVVLGGESPDSAPILVTVKKGATVAPGAFRVTNVQLR